MIERLHEEFWRRVKTQGSLPTEDAALVLLFGLVVSGQIGCVGSTGGARFRRSFGTAAGPLRDASRIGARSAFEERTYGRSCPDIASFWRSKPEVC